MAFEEIIFRVAGERDLDEVARLWLASALSADGGLADPPTLAQLRARLGEEPWEITLALALGAIVAFLAVNPARNSLAELYVAPDRQGGAIGRRLLARAKERMAQGFTLRTAAANLRARAFYEREGLRLIVEGAHPLRNAVCYYAWEPE